MVKFPVPFYILFEGRGGEKMAVIKRVDDVVLKLELDGGLVDGKQKIKSKRFNKVKLDAGDESIYETGVTLSGLQSKSLINVKRLDEVSLMEE